jgi:two-component system response regulator MprA
MATVLIVDDDASIRASLRQALAYEGYRVTVAEDGRAALRVAAEQPPDVVILDVMMPGLDGIEVCRRLREASDIPVLMLTARDGVNDRVTGLDSGADDYLVKPFALDELFARLRALLRRHDGERGDRVRAYADLSVDFASREVRRGDRRIELRSREYDLLSFLLSKPGEVMTRRRILAAVWGYPSDSNVLDVYVGYLRSKLEAGGEPRLVHTVRGVGYVLRLPLEDAAGEA